DLRLKLGLDAGHATRSTCIVVIESGARALGVIVDSVSSVIELAATQIEPPPELGDQSRLKFVLGMAKVETHVLILLDVAATLSPEELEQTHSIAAA
ncbi:MAG: chemotaxis protein CheW, partial [Betaproteobacteria bacterium]|nr:chemotaxis protein CheW [Betaproteobacteria bacterium]